LQKEILLTADTIHYDVIILGAGAAGLMCAIEAGKRGRSVLVLDHADKAAEKIRISGGGRCNFTNIYCGSANFISANPHFCKSALSRLSPNDFIALVTAHKIAFHEKTLGQLFCDEKAQQIIDMLLSECEQAGVDIRLKTEIQGVEKGEKGFAVHTTNDCFKSEALVIATGGPSIPKMGASGFAYEIAQQFGLRVIEPRAALVPLTFTDEIKEMAADLAGVSVDPVTVSCNKTMFREALLFTHRGLSGPAILQISSYWKPGDEIVINLSPNLDILGFLKEARVQQPKKMLHNILSEILPGRLAEHLAQRTGCDGHMAELSDKKLLHIADMLQRWTIKPSGTEGYRTAEVTAGGVDTAALSSQTFEAKKISGLYFIGECVDVTGHLGGHNFQWAWASGYCAGMAV